MSRDPLNGPVGPRTSSVTLEPDGNSSREVGQSAEPKDENWFPNVIPGRIDRDSDRWRCLPDEVKRDIEEDDAAFQRRIELERSHDGRLELLLDDIRFLRPTMAPDGRIDASRWHIEDRVLSWWNAARLIREIQPLGTLPPLPALPDDFGNLQRVMTGLDEFEWWLESAILTLRRRRVGREDSPAGPLPDAPDPLPTGAIVGEGETPKLEVIFSALLSASDIATLLGRKRESVTSFLTRFAKKSRDCRVEITSKRKNEPSYLYRTADVMPALEKWLKGQTTR